MLNGSYSPVPCRKYIFNNRQQECPQQPAQHLHHLLLLGIINIAFMSHFQYSRSGKLYIYFSIALLLWSGLFRPPRSSSRNCCRSAIDALVFSLGFSLVLAVCPLFFSNETSAAFDAPVLRYRALV